MTKCEELLRKIKEKGIDGITTDLSDASDKLLVLTKANCAKNAESLKTLTKRTLVLTESLEANFGDADVVYSDNFREDYALISKAFYGNVSDKMKFIFVSGTSGKTTTTYFISQIFKAIGEEVCVIGTDGCKYKDFCESFSMTTPDPHVLHRLLQKVYLLGARTVVMEASAHAVYLKKLCGIRAEVAALTNIARDHLDYFKAEVAYANAKKALFTKLYAKQFVLRNSYAKILQNSDIFNAFTYEIAENGSDIDGQRLLEKRYVVKGVCNDIDGVAFGIISPDGRYNVKNSCVIGKFNIENMMTAALSAIAFGLLEKPVFSALNALSLPSGRMEKVEGSGINIFVDYAHTPDALKRSLTEIEKSGRLIVVIGAGGDRDKGKREIYGRICGKYADITVITSDNPRYEKPSDIMHDIEKGVVEEKGDFVLIEDREDAIAFAIKTAQKDDTIIVSGKGAEEYVEISGKKLPFSDKKAIQRILGKL